MLFNAYTGGRPAEFVHASKGKASQDPLGEADESSYCKPVPEPTEKFYDDESDAGDDLEDDVDELLDDDDLDTSRSCDPCDEHIAMDTSTDSGYCSEETDHHTHEDDSIDTGGDDPRRSTEQDCDAAEVDEFGEARRKYKALCYEDIRIWIVQNPKQGEQDLLAMEVSLRHHKGVDKKPKPYVSLLCLCNLANLF